MSVVETISASPPITVASPSACSDYVMMLTWFGRAKAAPTGLKIEGVVRN